MPSCSASESDSKIRPANFQTRHKPPVRNYRRIQTGRGCLQVADSLFTSSPTFHRPWSNRISKYSISFSGSFAGESFRAGFRAIQNTPKTPARSGSGLCLFSLFRRDRLRQLRKNTDMHPLVGNNLIEKLDSYCGRLCQLFGIVFPDTLDQLLIGGNRIFFGLDIDPNSLGSRFIFDRNRRTRILRSIHAPAQVVR